MRAWLAALVFALSATAARAQIGVPVEPFVLTTPDYPSFYPVFGENAANCARTPYPPNRSGRRGSNPEEEQHPNPACPAR